MSNASLDEIQELIQKLSGELGDMSEAASRHIDDLHIAVNNVASHVLAIEAVLSLVAKKVDIDEAEALKWIRDKTAAYAEDTGIRSRSFSGTGPPAAQSSNCTVCRTFRSSVSICTMQPILPVATRSGWVARILPRLRS